MALNFLELASDYKSGKLTFNDKKIKRAERMIEEIAATEDGKNQLADIVGIVLQESMNFLDIAPMISENKHFTYGERPEFRLKQKGVKAYWIAPNSSTPKTRNYDSVLTMEFETLSVRPTALLSDLEHGRIRSLMELLVDAQEALRYAIVEKIFTILDQAYNAEKEEDGENDRFYVDSTGLTEETLKKAIRRVTYKNGGNPVILGDKLLVDEICDFKGFAPALEEEIQRTGKLGTYYGASIIGVHKVYDEANDKVVIPEKRLYVIGNKIGYSATYGDMKSGQETSIEDWTWNTRQDIEWGFAITNPEALAVVEKK